MKKRANLTISIFALIFLSILAIIVISASCKSDEMDPSGQLPVQEFPSKSTQPTQTTKTEDNAKSLFEQGNSYLEQELWNEAIEAFTKVIKLDPELEAAARVGRGIANAWASNYQQSENDFNEAYELSGERLMTTDAYLAWGIAITAQYSSYSKLDEADYLFRRVISATPNNPDAYTGRALARLKLAFGDIIEAESIGFHTLCQAISDFEKAIDLDPEGVQGRINRFNFEGDMAFLPNYVEANRRCGAVLLSTDIYVSKGLEEYDSILKVYPDDVEALIGRGSAYIRLEQYDNAILDFNRAVELAPRSADAHAGRGIAYSMQIDYDAASKDFKNAIMLDNRYEQGYYYPAYMTASYFEDENPISFGKAFIKTFRGLGDEYLKNNNFGLAIDSYTLAINMDYDHWIPNVDDKTLAYYGRAKAYSNVEEYDKAIADFEEAASDSENEIYYTLGAEYFVPFAVTYWKMGNYGAAAGAFSEAEGFVSFEEYMDAEAYLAMGIARYHDEDKWGSKIWGYRAVEYALNKAIELSLGSSIAAEAQEYLNKLNQNRDAFP